MQLTYVAVVILASMVFVLSGMVGYLYWQQTRMLQHLQSLAGVVSTHLVPRPEPEAEAETETEEVLETEDEMPALVPLPTVSEAVAETDDDRLSVDKVDGPPAATAAPATEDLEKKTAAELRELLTSRSIPFGKRDSKSVLLQPLKATA